MRLINSFWSRDESVAAGVIRTDFLVTERKLQHEVNVGNGLIALYGLSSWICCRRGIY